MTFTVFIVDDDVGVLKAMARRLRMKNYNVETFSSPRDFLAAHDPSIAGCVLLDVSMPDLDGLALQEALSADGNTRPIVFITGKGDIPTTVRAMRAGAVDFLTKPVGDPLLLDAIHRAESIDAEQRMAQLELASLRSRLANLTAREREVLTHVIAGRLSKQIAFDLGTVEQTIKVHRRRIMEKLGARSMQDLMRIAAKIEILD